MTIYNINGLGPVVVNGYVNTTTGYNPNNPSVPLVTYEYTSGILTTQFNSDMETILGVLNKRPDSVNPPDNTIVPTQTDYANLISAMANLTQLAQNGVNNDPLLPGSTYYMTAQMAGSLGQVLSSLNAVGISVQNAQSNPPSDPVALIQQWQSLAGFGIQQVVQNAVASSIGATSSLQSMIELEYVKEGNDYIATNLGNLEAALSTSQGIVNNLTVVQNILNQITVTNSNSVNFTTSSLASNFTQIPSGAIAALEALNMPNQTVPASYNYILSQITPTNTEVNPDPINPGALDSLLTALAAGNVTTNTFTAQANAFLGTAYINDKDAMAGLQNFYNNPANELGGISFDQFLGEQFLFTPSLGQTALSDYLSLKSNPPLITVSVSFKSAYANDIAGAVSLSQAGGTTYASALALQTQAALIINKYIAGSPTNYVSVYHIMASAQFTQIFPTATPTSNAFSSLLAAYNSLKTGLTNLQTQTGQSASTQNSLAYFINLVAKDISSHIVNLNTTGLTAPAITALQNTAISQYIIDNQNKQLDTAAGFKAGSIQTNVTNAVSSAQNLNNQQQVQVTNYEFIFQSFYTSASDVLTNLSKILEGIAQSIAKQ